MSLLWQICQGNYRKFLGFLVPVGEKTTLHLVDFEVRHLEPDCLVRVAGEEQVLHRVSGT